jgi:hypothetical protein
VACLAAERRCFDGVLREKQAVEIELSRWSRSGKLETEQDGITSSDMPCRKEAAFGWRTWREMGGRNWGLSLVKG